MYVTNGSGISIDCYDDVNPELVTPATMDTLDHPPEKMRPDMTKGSVKVTSYNVMSISSTDVKRLSLAPCVIDIVLLPGELQCQTIDKSSIPIVGGLHDQMSNRQMKATVPKRLRGTIRLPRMRGNSK